MMLVYTNAFLLFMKRLYMTSPLWIQKRVGGLWYVRGGRINYEHTYTQGKINDI